MPAHPLPSPSAPQGATAISAPGAQALYAVAASFDEGADPATALTALLRRFSEAVGATRAALMTPEGAGPVAVWAQPSAPGGLPAPEAAGPATPADQITLALFHSRMPVGTLVLGGPAGWAFSPAARRTAEALCRPAAAVVAVARRLAAAEKRAQRLEEQAALHAAITAAVDHDLRTPLTTILGALQTAARPEFAPADPEVAALLASALGQAQRMRRLLADLLIGSSAQAPAEPLAPAGLTALVAEAAEAGMGGGRGVEVEVPEDLPPIAIDVAALRRALAGVLRELRRRGVGGRVRVAAGAGGWQITVVPSDGGPLPVPELPARLAAHLGGRLEPSGDGPGVRLVLPAVPPAPD